MKQIRNKKLISNEQLSLVGVIALVFGFRENVGWAYRLTSGLKSSMSDQFERYSMLDKYDERLSSSQSDDVRTWYVTNCDIFYANLKYCEHLDKRQHS